MRGGTVQLGNPIDFTGRAVIVTGGTKGIGAAIAEAFLSAGAEVVVCGRTTPAALPSSGGRQAAFVPADVRDPAAAALLVAATVQRSGRLDVLVNNAGGSPDADAATVSPASSRRSSPSISSPPSTWPRPPIWSCGSSRRAAA